VVRANAGIRAVIEMSRRVSLVAINASLVAKQAGTQARGFGVVSRELREFSAKLEGQMQALDQLIAEAVMGLAEAAKENRRARQLRLAQDGSADCASLERSMARVDARLAEANLVNSSRWLDLVQRLRLILRQCGIGAALARSAKVEAVYGGSAVGALRQVAQEIEESVGDIQATLARLNREVEAKAS
jgi:hypothetical protein